MNDLQLTLLLVGATGVAGMMLYNWWQYRSLQQQTRQRFGDTAHDPLLEPLFEPRTDSDPFADDDEADTPPELAKPSPRTRAEPKLHVTVDDDLDDALGDAPYGLPDNALDDGFENARHPAREYAPHDAMPASAAASASASASTSAPKFEPNQAAATSPMAALQANNVVAEPIDKRLFAELYIYFDAFKDEATWRGLTEGLAYLQRKKILYAVGAIPVDQPQLASEVQTWYQAVPFVGQANVLRVAIQLVNRKGPINSLDFSEVLAKLRRFAEHHHAELDFPNMKDVIAKAETLDAAAAALDTLLGLHCLLPETVEEAQTRQNLGQCGWVQRGHQWTLPLDGEVLLATMVVHPAPGKRLMSFNIDVPNSPDPVRALAEVVRFCHAMNEEHGAPLMDDSGRTLNTAAIEGIYNQLIERIRHLSDSGFKPGEHSTRVLFS